ncbi:MAG TPA: hypothetical protein VIJ39_10290 [Solirubrobacteraceae bacterium]
MIVRNHPYRRLVSRTVMFACTFVALLVLGVGSASAQPSTTKPFEVVPGSFHFTTSTQQAGAHADWTTSFDFAHNSLGRTFNDVKTTVVELPPGFTGNNTAVPTCTQSQLVGAGFGEKKGPLCPAASQIGTLSAHLAINKTSIKVKIPVFNMEVTSPGVAAALGFNVAGSVVQTLPVTVRSNLALTVTSPNIEGITEPHEIAVTIWGVPGAKSHDEERGEECYAFTPEEKAGSTEPECINGGKTVNGTVKPFLSNPTSCVASAPAKLRADSWEEPNNWSYATTEITPASECARVPFDPTMEVLPTTNAAESPSGLALSLVVPQSWEKPETISTSDLDGATVTLPVGYTVNPSAGSGLVACTPEDRARETYSSLPGEGCPAESKLGTVKIVTPLLAEEVSGAVYIAQPYNNPFDSLLALYVVAKDPARGIVVNVAGKVEANPVTGQLVTTFDENPQVPFSKFTFEFHQGQTSPLVSPPTCGSYTVLSDLTPWSVPEESRNLSYPFSITQGVHGGPCPVGRAPPFKPSVIAGTSSNAGGSYSPFYLRISREDGEQEITKFSTVLPPGLTGNLTGIPFCPNSAVEAARQASGIQEINAPSCPAASEIGHSLVGAGVGGVLAWTPGKIYLAGPYNGAPLSIVSVTSATVGPFDLGTVVIRFALRINPTTAQAEVDSSGSDPIPHIIDGIVVHVRDIHVYMERSHFILNPTSCAPMPIHDTITGAGADFTNPADQVPVSVATPFQAADCQSLGFKPTLKATAAGKTSRARGAGLTFKLTYPTAPEGSQANIHSVKVDLPKQLPSRLSTLQKACPDATFEANPAACPEGSRVGSAIAHTPIIPVPLTGPAYFVSHGGLKFPELILVLQGYGVTIDLHSETFISKAGITSGTFHAVPDAPVSTFELSLPEGPNSALAANKNLCQLTRTVSSHKTVTVKNHGHTRRVVKTVKKSVPATLAMPTAFTAQNGAVIHTTTPVSISGCPKPKKRASRG